MRALQILSSLLILESREVISVMGTQYGDQAQRARDVGWHADSARQAGEMTLDEETLDLNAMVLSSLMLVKSRADAGEVNLENNTPGNPHLFLGESRKIKQILTSS